MLFRRDYEKIARARGFFGDFDPFGDFDLLFGALRDKDIAVMALRLAPLARRIVTVPVPSDRSCAAATLAGSGWWSEENAMLVAPGSRFGPYCVLREIAHGGMGAVYKAHDKDLDRTVALKLVRPDLMADLETMQRFIN